MADGNMYQNEKGKLQFSIKIKNTDKDILYKFANEIEFPIEKITQREEKRKGSITKCAEIKIYNQKFCSYLVNLGVVPRKTGKEYMPNIKDEFKSCTVTGIIGLLVGVSIVLGSYHLLNRSSNSESPKKISTQKVKSQNREYWTPQKDR